MRGYSRSALPTKRNDKYCFCKYLKPGALAQLRDSKISARSHRPNSVLTGFISHRVDSVSSSQISIIDHHHHHHHQVPCFLMSKICGTPQCLKKKKLVAVKPVFFLNLEANYSNNANNNNNNDSFVNVLNNDVIVAH